MKKFRGLFHAAFWIILWCLWVFFFRNRSLGINKSMTVEFCYLLFIALDFYVIEGVFLPRFFDHKKYLIFISASISLILASSLCRAGLASFMNLHFFLAGKDQPPFLPLFFNSLLNIFVWVELLVAARMIFNKIQNRQYIAMIEQEKIRNELNFLRAQVNPHFLFNSLNSIYGHIDKTNKTARNILLKFSEILRYQLYECNADQIIMEKEIQYIQNYIALERYRKEENLIVNLFIDSSLNKFSISPLLLLVFIENAFKYVSSSEESPNQLNISLKREDNWLYFSVSNTIDSAKDDLQWVPVDPPEKSRGIGLTNVKRRLEMLYPDKHYLNIEKNKTSFDVLLSLDLS